MVTAGPTLAERKSTVTGESWPPSTPSDAELLETAALHLALLAVPGIGTVKAFRLLEAYGCIGIVATSDDDVGAAVRRHADAARAAVGRAAAMNLSVVPFEHPGYPLALLDAVEGPPPVLFMHGTLPPTLDLPAAQLQSCAIVGTRRASRYSLDLAATVAQELVSNGILVVSGLALGVDAAAHQGALAGARARQGSASIAGVPATVAVLGGGHRHLHPAGHANLAERIVGQGGAVISEWPPDVPPARHHFLRRNRIISGLSRCVLVVEAGRRSGALNTAAHALQQDRHVIVVPGRPDDPRYAGNLGLLREVSQPFVDSSDVLMAYGITHASPADRSGGSAQSVPIPWTSPLPTVVLGPESGSAAAVVRRILAAEHEVSLDGLMSRLGGATVDKAVVSAAELTALLTALTLSGEVEQTVSGRYRLRRITATHG